MGTSEATKSLNLEKLTPAPWTRRLYNWDECEVIGPKEIHVAFCTHSPLGHEHAEFIALARNAFDVMMRRGWTAELGAYDGRHPKEWHTVDAHGRGIRYGDELRWFADPFTALVEAERWMREQEAKRCNEATPAPNAGD